ncbi:MAG: holo-ACP synthase [Acidobacteriota bacterium]
MILGTGIDIVQVARIEEAIRNQGESFLKRVFTEEEMRYCNSLCDHLPSIAARFAAKEAAMKALATGWSGGVSWKDIGVVSVPPAAPYIVLTGEAEKIFQKLGGRKVHCSLSHHKDYAAAIVIIEG